MISLRLLFIALLVVFGCEDKEKDPLPLDCAEVEGGNNICGCIDSDASNYYPATTYDDGSCRYYTRDVSMVLHPVDSPQYAGINWYQNLFSVEITNNENEKIQYRIIFSLTISNLSFISGEILTGETRVGVKEGWDGGMLPHGTLEAGMSETIYNNDFHRMEHLFVDPGFNAIVASTGVMPPGDYELIVTLQVNFWSDYEELVFINPPNHVVATVYHEWIISEDIPE